MRIENRVFVSFDEPCFFECKHCFSYGIHRTKLRTEKEIVESVSDKQFDIIYVSQKNDNFSDFQKGLHLCESLFERYQTNLFIITRNVFDSDGLLKLSKLRDRMRLFNKSLFIAVSINATNSFYVCENTGRVPSPSDRIAFIKKLSQQQFNPILMLRPVFPSKFIPINECIHLLETLAGYASCVVSSELGINKDILQRLDLKESDFRLKDNQDYLQGAIESEIKFINVENELRIIKEKCTSLSVPFFEHSLPAINYLLNNSLGG